MEKITAFILRIRYLTIIMVVLLTVLLGYQIKDLKVNADVLGYLPDDDGAAMLFSRIGEDYGGNELIIIGLEGESVFSYEMLDIVRKVTDSVRMVSGIGYVTSLTNVIDIRGADGFIEIGRLIDEYDIPQDEEVLAVLKEYALSKAMYRGNLVSEDGTATLVVAKVLGDANRTEVVEQIQEKLKNLQFAGSIYYGGMPVTLLELSRTIIHDVKFIAPIAFILISLMLALGFRSRRGVLLPMLTVVIAIIWTMGLISMLGYALTLLTNVIPVILMAVGSAYAIHVVNRVNEKMQEHKKEALKEAITGVMIPVMLASLTTIIGFLSFIAGSYLTMIREFGIFTAIGIVFSLLLTLVFLPALMSIFDNFKRKAANETSSSFIRYISRFFSSLALGNQVVL
ncbi:MAG: efflux RND transporter permease subunit, partial [Bacteroidales bacterium]|nr:efflux RND transporter permease subunit [Bacteroidales bacterium]